MGFFGPSEVKKLKEKGDVEGLIKELEKSDYRNAAEALRQIGDKRAVAPLLKALEHYLAKGEISLEVIQALGEFGVERAVVPLVTVLENRFTDAKICFSIVAAFRNIGSEAAIEALIKALSNYSTEGGLSPIGVDVSTCSKYALIGIGEPAVGPLTKAIEHEENESLRGRMEAIKAEIQIRIFINMGKSGVEPLIKALDDDYNYYRQLAADALGQVGDEKALDALTLMTKDKRLVNRIAAKGAIKNISKRLKQKR